MPAEFIDEFRPACIATGFLWIAAVLFEFSLNPSTAGAGFLAAFVVYFADHRLPEASVTTWPLIFVLSLLFTFLVLLSGQFSLRGTGGYVLLALFYVLPLLPGKKRLQDFPFARILAVALGWACMPLLIADFPRNPSSALYLTAQAGFLLPAILFSDLADEEKDRNAGRVTWTLLRSVKQQKAVILGSASLSVLFFIFSEGWVMVPGPLLYMFLYRPLRRHPHQSDWILLWPVAAGLLCFKC